MWGKRPLKKRTKTHRETRRRRRTAPEELVAMSALEFFLSLSVKGIPHTLNNDTSAIFIADCIQRKCHVDDGDGTEAQMLSTCLLNGVKDLGVRSAVIHANLRALVA